jgi:dynein heavy chain 1
VRRLRPRVAVVATGLAVLRDHIAAICRERHLVPAPQWIDKLVQLYQVLLLRHGCMMVGPSGSGKTASWAVLQKALERMDGVETKAYVLDPKAITKDSLSGTLAATTREWTDGLFTALLRKIVDNLRGEAHKRHWIIFDGDVGPEWVENLNSLLADNKLLTLPNGERLALPNNVRVLFEVQDLKYATLPTVSRCGMVWFSEETLTTQMLFVRYLTRLREEPFDEQERDQLLRRRTVTDAPQVFIYISSHYSTPHTTKTPPRLGSLAASAPCVAMRKAGLMPRPQQFGARVWGRRTSRRSARPRPLPPPTFTIAHAQ